MNVKDLAAAVLMMYDQYGSSRIVAERCNKSKSWVSKRLQLAKNIGPLTVELMDTVTDIELLYMFAKLETAEKDSARLIANDIKQGIAGRAKVNATLAKALNPDDDDDDQEQSELVVSHRRIEGGICCGSKEWQLSASHTLKPFVSGG